ncbi:kinase-like domain-containing protein, partial [Mycena sp. CBHHK59/15]
VSEGLECLHLQRVVYGDLRGPIFVESHSNVQIGPAWEVKLTDFGLSVFFHARIGDTASICKGSINWLAPELLSPSHFELEGCTRTTPTDVYAFACVCLEV